MTYINQYQYYTNNGNAPEDANWGSYQYVSLQDIVNNFMLMYQGNHELVNNINRFQILFHAKRGIQELNYDAMKEIKVLQLDVGNNSRFILPADYVNWVRISQFRKKSSPKTRGARLEKLAPAPIIGLIGLGRIERLLLGHVRSPFVADVPVAAKTAY